MSMNLGVLQRLDPKITRILNTAGHVALYKFLLDTQAWVRINNDPLLSFFSFFCRLYSR